MPELWRDFLTHSGHPAHKWTHYFPVYEHHFARYQNRPALFWEIGVGQGGSLQLWKQFLGPYAQIIGLDIEDKQRYEEEQISIRTGDQCDTGFLQSVLDEFGTPDVVLDDGSHVMAHVAATFRYLYPKTAPSGVYLIEDLHTAYWAEYGGGLREPGSFMEMAKDLIDELNAEDARGALEPTEFTASTLSIHFYPSIVVFERGRYGKKHAPHTGNPKELPVWPKPRRFPRPSALRPKGPKAD